jgi:hypothetical protein
MSHPLVELSRVRNQTSAHIITEDYNKNPRFCRHGVWIGWQVNFTETVVLSYEHDPEELYVGWAINGTTVVDPGYGSGTPPWGAPAPGDPSITYVTPLDGLFHKISLTSTSGSNQECVQLQVLYRTPAEAVAPFHHGPMTSVCVSGSEIEWPAKLLEEERQCFAHFFDLLRRYVKIAFVKPGDPVEQWISRLRGDDVVRIRAELETLQLLDGHAQQKLADAIKSDLVRVLRTRMPGAGNARGLDDKR